MKIGEPSLACWVSTTVMNVPVMVFVGRPLVGLKYVFVESWVGMSSKGVSIALRGGGPVGWETGIGALRPFSEAKSAHCRRDDQLGRLVVVVGWAGMMIGTMTPAMVVDDVMVSGWGGVAVDVFGLVTAGTGEDGVTGSSSGEGLMGMLVEDEEETKSGVGDETTSVVDDGSEVEPKDDDGVNSVLVDTASEVMIPGLTLVGDGVNVSGSGVNMSVPGRVSGSFHQRTDLVSGCVTVPTAYMLKA